jgi:4-hydroxy-4-methyl-2-oxoglutarate aldolase
MTNPTRLLPPSELAPWSRIPTAVVSDERHHQGVLLGIRPLFPGRPFAAQAFTIEVGSSAGTAPRAALVQAWPAACIVIDARARPDAAVWGGNLIRAAQARRLVAIVVDGNVRDVVELRDSGIAVCSRGITPRGPAWSGRVGGSIRCGGIEVRAGDLIVGDEDGVVAVPLDDVNGELLTRCQVRLAREAEGKTA